METVLVLRNRTERKQLYRKRMLSALILLVIYIGAASLVRTESGGNVFWEEIQKDISYTDEGATSDKMFSNRMIIWKYCFEMIGDYPFVGVGPENLKAITNFYDTPEELKIYDRAHNEYINLMICEGIPAVTVYIIFLFVIFIPGVRDWKKKENGYVYLSLFLAFFAYIAQAFFNISTIQVAPYFWVICGLLAGENRSEA